MSALGRPFALLWSASALTNLADGVAVVAWPWLASTITRDPVALAAAGLMARLPWLLFALPFGVLVDRVDRGRLMAACDAGRTAVLVLVAGTLLLWGGSLGNPVGITPADFQPPPHQAAWLVGLYAAALLLGTIEVARDSAAQAFLPALVERGQLERANGRLMSTEVVANSLAGPPLGGALVAAALLLPFAVSAGAFAVAAVLLFAIGARPRPRAPRQGLRRDLTSGFRYLWGNDLLRHMALILGGVNFAATLAMATAVLFAQEVLGVTGPEYGLMLTGGAIGGVAGGLLAARINRRIGPGGVVNAALLAMGLVFLIASQMTDWRIVWVLILLESFTAIVWNVVTVSLRQRIIPDDLFGRVNSVYRFLSWGVIPLGALAGGVVVTLVEPWLGRAAGLRAPFVVGAILSLAALAFAGRWLTNRRISEALAAAPEPAG